MGDGADDGLGIDAAVARPAGGAPHEHAVGKRRNGERLDVVGHEVVAAVGERPRARRAEERERAARTHAEREERRRARRRDERHHVIEDRLLGVHALGLRLEVEHLLDAEHRDERVRRRHTGAAQDRLLVAARGVADPDAQEESVELRFGQRVRPLVLERVLSREHHEGTRQLVRRVVERHLGFIHRFQQTRLGLRGGSIDLVGQDDVGEEGARLEDERAALGLPDRDAEDIGREHVGGELDALEAGADGSRQRGGQRGLADAGDVLDQQVTARHQADHGEAHHLRLADQGAADVRLQPADQLERTAHAPLISPDGACAKRRQDGRARRASARWASRVRGKQMTK